MCCHNVQNIIIRICYSFQEINQNIAYGRHKRIVEHRTLRLELHGRCEYLPQGSTAFGDAGSGIRDRFLKLAYERCSDWLEVDFIIFDLVLCFDKNRLIKSPAAGFFF